MQPAGLEDMQDSVNRELRHLVQRPRMEDGEMVATDKLTFTHNFYYRTSDLPQPEEEAAESIADAASR